jgi:hypothetical protein
MPPRSRTPAYREELAAWVRDPDRGDGLPPQAVESPAGRGTSLRLRDFTLSGSEHSTGEAPPAERPDVVVVSTRDDVPRSWLEAGQALGMLLLDAAAAGVQAQPLGQVTDLPGRGAGSRPCWACAASRSWRCGSASWTPRA